MERVSLSRSLRLVRLLLVVVVLVPTDEVGSHHDQDQESESQRPHWAAHSPRLEFLASASASMNSSGKRPVPESV